MAPESQSDEIDAPFRATVTGHTKYKSGVDLHLLDEGTQEEPRFVRIFNDDRDTEWHL